MKRHCSLLGDCALKTEMATHLAFNNMYLFSLTSSEEITACNTKITLIDMWFLDRMSLLGQRLGRVLFSAYDHLFVEFSTQN